MIRIVHFNDTTKVDHDKWNKACIHPMQSIEWADIRKIHGVEIALFATVNNSEDYESVFLMTIHKIPRTSFRIGYIPKSKSFPDQNTLNEIQKFCKTHNIIFVKFEPHLLHSPSVTVPHHLKKSPHPIFTKFNQILDLTTSEDELLTKMHHKTRYNIKLATKKGVKVKEMSDIAGYKIFEKLYFETCKRQNYRGHTPKYHEIIWKNLSVNQQDKNSLNSRILISYFEDKPLGVMQLWTFHNTMYYVYGGSDTTHKEVMAPNRLMWEAIKLAKSSGCSIFDMWGSLSKDYDPKDPWAGFTRFKEGYGTEYVEYSGSYDLVVNKPLYSIYNVLHKVREKLI
ncbi:MAG: peptidoglycan bridge formation glycyltransferase FemA/FemB family protein [Patescibacteria group bacterium]